MLARGGLMRFDTKVFGVLRDDDGGSPTKEELEAFMDAVVAELETLRADDIDVSTNLRTGEVKVGVSVDVETIFDAQAEGGGMIRAAFHAAGATTKDWQVEFVNATASPQHERDLIDA
jgi:hypothetical protein